MHRRRSGGQGCGVQHVDDCRGGAGCCGDVAEIEFQRRTASAGNHADRLRRQPGRAVQGQGSMTSRRQDRPSGAIPGHRAGQPGDCRLHLHRLGGAERHGQPQPVGHAVPRPDRRGAHNAVHGIDLDRQLAAGQHQARAHGIAAHRLAGLGRGELGGVVQRIALADEAAEQGLRGRCVIGADDAVQHHLHLRPGRRRARQSRRLQRGGQVQPHGGHAGSRGSPLGGGDGAAEQRRAAAGDGHVRRACRVQRLAVAEQVAQLQAVHRAGDAAGYGPVQRAVWCGQGGVRAGLRCDGGLRHLALAGFFLTPPCQFGVARSLMR